MPFKFSSFCELLDTLARNKDQHERTASRRDKPDHEVVKGWYDKYDGEIERIASGAAVAFLSAFFPERRPDRTYNLQDKRLCHIFGSALCLGSSRLRELQSWQRNDGEDFAICLQRVMSTTEVTIPSNGHEVTLEELDEALTKIDANTISSSPKIRTLATFQKPLDILKPIIRRLRSNEAKWLVRMIRKSYSPVEIPEYMALYRFHFMLPKLLHIQNCFETAVKTLSHPQLSKFRPSNEEEEKTLMTLLANNITPVLGIMVHRQPFWKARSIKHCVKMAEKRTMSIERKYDGEYCQIHIDASQKIPKIQIFSKNGRDATQDRFAVHEAIKAGLKLGQADCKIKSRAILEGELLIFSTLENRILPFYHVRKHVRHGGRRIGTERDSPRKPGEMPMIAFYDILLLDDDVLLTRPHKRRRAMLKGVVTHIPGFAQVVERVQIDFADRNAPGILRTTFGAAIRNRWEGLVLKGLEDPYFDWTDYNQSIKLKKDYIGGLGDSVDLCVIAGRRVPRDEIEYNLGMQLWTSFYVAALINKDEVRRFSERPIFRILDCLEPCSMSKEDIFVLNAEGKLTAHEYVTDSPSMVIEHPRSSIPPPTHFFKSPLVIELMGAGYERPQSADFWILRFPRRTGSKIRVHRDRDITDTVSFDELQAMAQQSLNDEDEIETQEDVKWIERLLAADPKPAHNVDKSQSTGTPRTLHSETTVDLTPAQTARSHSQQTPFMVRMDSEELTAADIFGNHAESCPILQTPSGRSDVSTTPPSSGSSRVSKRDFGALGDTPSPTTSRKRRRVEFEDDIHDLHSVPRVALSTVLNPTDDRPEQSMNSLHTNDKRRTADAKEQLSKKHKNTTTERKATKSESSQVSPPRKKRSQQAPLEDKPAPSTSQSDSTQISTSENSSVLRVAQKLVHDETIMSEVSASSSTYTSTDTHVMQTAFTEPPSSFAGYNHTDTHNLMWTGGLHQADLTKIEPMLLKSSSLNSCQIIHTQDTDFFLEQTIIQSRISSEKHRLKCIALLNFSDTEATVVQLRALARRITLDHDVTGQLLSEGEASITVCDVARVLRTRRRTRTGSDNEETDIGVDGTETWEHDFTMMLGSAAAVMKIFVMRDEHGDGSGSGDSLVKVKMFWNVKES